MVTSNQIRRIIREELLASQFRSSRDRAGLHKRLNESQIHLAPSVTLPEHHTISFGKLFEHCDAGMLTENQAIKLWHKSIDYNISQIDEGVMDALKSAYEVTKSGAIKLKDKISAAASAAWKKVNDMFLEMCLQAMSVAQRSIEAAVKATKKIYSAVQRFKGAHPVLYKIIVISLITILVFAMMTMFSSSAQAAVKMQGGRGAGGTMSETQYKILRGALDEYGNSQGIGSDAMFSAGKAVEQLDIAFKGDGVVDIKTLQQLTQNGQKMVSKVVGEMEGGDDGAFELLKHWLKLGKSLGSVKTSGG